jgi:exonuclease III
MTGITTYLPVLTLNVNGLNSSIKRYHLMYWIKKKDSKIFCLQETHLIDRNKQRPKVKGLKRFTKAMASKNRQE